MGELINLIKEWSFSFNLSISIVYTKVLDWHITIQQGNHNKYKILFETQSSDLNICTSKAYLFLTEWLMENNDGY